MAAPSELTQDAIKNFMIEHGGKVTNHELVKHFKHFLTDPETRVEARNMFKEYVNEVATIRNEDGEKYLLLKKKYRAAAAMSPGGYTTSPSPSPSSESLASGPYVSTESLPSLASPSRQAAPPPYRAPPPPNAASPSPEPPHYREPPPAPQKSRESSPQEPTPPVPPRRKSSDKIRIDNKENIDITKRSKIMAADPAGKEDASEPPEQLSVKERTQVFNRLATEGDLQRALAQPAKKKPDRAGADDEDSVSLTSEPKAREWLVAAAQGDHIKLSKLAQENPRLAALRDPTMGYTALHWGAKHGNDDLVKMMAGTYRVDVNARSNGGYTPLHLATQMGHEDTVNLLINVYGADQNLRDYSGRKARQYQTSQDTTVSADTFRRIKAATTLRNQSKEKTSRKGLRLLENWFTECESEENN